MTPTLLTCTFLLLLPADAPRAETPRKPNPFAPSLPLLTDEEEEKLDRIIDRFIQYDIGKLRGEEGKRALAEFQRLGPEATLALIRGMNRAALIEASCPAVVIAKKLSSLLGATEDIKLLQFAYENIGLGVERSRHLVVLKDLRLACAIRKGALQRKMVAGGTPAGQKLPRSMSVAELAEAIGTERGPRLKSILAELELRKGDEVTAALGSAASALSEADLKQLARDSLARHLARQAPIVIRDKLSDDRAEVRAAAARVTGVKGLRYGSELIRLLEDSEPTVSQSARQALIQLSRGNDFGPKPDASADDRADAIRKWKAWWSRQAGR